MLDTLAYAFFMTIGVTVRVYFGLSFSVCLSAVKWKAHKAMMDQISFLFLFLFFVFAFLLSDDVRFCDCRVGVSSLF